jgi:hypothetical protein
MDSKTQESNTTADSMARTVGGIVGVVASIGILVVPFTLMMIRQRDAAEMFRDGVQPVVASLAVGLGVFWRLRRKSGASVAVLLGAAVGFLLAAIIGLSNFRGFGVLLPPAIALALGLINGISDEQLRGYREPVILSMLLGFLISVGLTIRQGPSIVLIGLAIGVVVGTVVGSRRHPERGWIGGVRLPPLGLTLLVIGWLVLSGFGLYGEMLDGRSEPMFGLGPLGTSIAFGPVFTVLIPAFVFSVGNAVATWLRPRLGVYRDLVGYIHIMYVPIGAFALGSSLITLVFAGIYGSLYKLSPTHFTATEVPGRLDWFFFAFNRASGSSFEGVAAASDAANLVAAVQVLVTVGWAVVVFAAVMNYVQPKLQQLHKAE